MHYSVKEVGEILGKLRGGSPIKRSAIYSYISQKKLKTGLEGREHVISKYDLKEFVEKYFVHHKSVKRETAEEMGYSMPFLTVEEVAEKLGKLRGIPDFGITNVYNYINTKRLKATKTYSRISVITETDFREFVEKDYLLVHKLDESELEKLGIRKTHFSLGEIAIKIRKICNVPSIIEYDVYFIAQKLNLKMNKNGRGHIRITESEMEEFIEKIIHELKRHDFKNIYNQPN
jgi:hypothetical protein